MTREDRALALLAEANPVPDEARYTLGAERRAHLDDVEQWSDNMTDTQLRQASSPPKRPRRTMGAMAALLVLLIGIATAWVLRGDSTDVVTPAPELPSITYTGLDCIYSGPSQFSMSDDMTFLFTNTSPVFGGATLYPAGAAATVPADGSYPLWIRDEFYEIDLNPGESGEFTATPSEPGRWIIVCGTDSENATEEIPNLDRYATILDVLP